MKRIPKEKEQEKIEKIEDQTRMVKAAMEMGFTTKKDICKSANIEMWELNGLFKEDKDLHAMFNVRRRSLVDMAADNMTSIVKDPDHPNNFAATKYVLQKYKSDLDEVLESHEVNPLEIDVPSGNGSTKPVIIRFGKPDKK